MIKKIGILLMMVFLVGCHSIQNEEQITVYSFTGENEYRCPICANVLIRRFSL